MDHDYGSNDYGDEEKGGIVAAPVKGKVVDSLKSMVIGIIVATIPFASAAMVIALTKFAKAPTPPTIVVAPPAVAPRPAATFDPFPVQCPWCRRIFNVSPPVNGSMPIGDKPPAREDGYRLPFIPRPPG